MIIAVYAACGFAVAGIHAWFLARNKESGFHRYALRIALSIGGVAAFLQPFSGDYTARTVAHNQPVKLAAMEGQFETERAEPLRIGGIPDKRTRPPCGSRWKYRRPEPAGIRRTGCSDSRAE
jgi:cytochrome d ubiquinol oxidase subunit I